MYFLLRQGLATYLLNTADEDLEINARKLKHGLPASLRHAAATGQCSMKLYVLSKEFGRTCVETTYNEMINKGLSIGGQRAPNISLELLSSRTTLKAEVGFKVRTELYGKHKPRLRVRGKKYRRQFTRQWSHIKDDAEKVLERCPGREHNMPEIQMATREDARIVQIECEF